MVTGGGLAFVSIWAGGGLFTLTVCALVWIGYLKYQRKAEGGDR